MIETVVVRHEVGGVGVEAPYAGKLKEAGFQRGRAAPIDCQQEGGGDSRRGGDFTFLGRDRHLREMTARIDQWYDIRILNRVVKLEPNKITYEADDKHMARIMDDLGFDEHPKCHNATVAGHHDEDDGDGEPLSDQDSGIYRLVSTMKCVAACMWMPASRSLWRTDIGPGRFDISKCDSCGCRASRSKARS